jgi:transcriptional regulator with XRE-family HTH domain
MRDMRDVEVARAFRAVRLRRGWRQLDVARRAGVSRERISDLENGEVGSFPLRTMRVVGAALDIDVTLVARWRGGELARLLDAGHAALGNAFAREFERAGWEVIPERTYSEYGERGSIDLLAFHASTRVLAVVEVKTVIADIQDLLARLDAKARLGGRIAASLGWRAHAVVPILVVAESTTSRRRMAAHDALFARFSLRGPAVRAWIRSPVPVSGVLAFMSLPSGTGAAARLAGRQRVRVSGPRQRSR